jgi:hypothetical protein
MHKCFASLQKDEKGKLLTLFSKIGYRIRAHGKDDDCKRLQTSIMTQKENIKIKNERAQRFRQ